jgi:UPF0755 protein
MSQGDRSTRSTERISRIKRPTRKLSVLQLFGRLAVLGIVIGLLALAFGLVYRTMNQRGNLGSVSINLPVNPSLNPAEAALLGAYLSLNQADLDTPASTDSSQVIFEIEPGQTASDVASRLTDQGLISDAGLFRNYLRYYGLDSQLEAGSFQLSASMTIPEIAVSLTDAAASEISVRVTEGWRREQIGQYIDREPEIPFSGADFVAYTGPGSPALAASALGTELPTGASLEGFLFPDTYRILPDATAADLVEKMLANFESKFTAQMRADAAAKGLTLYQVVTLASIVEREAVVADERPTIASVYLNRLQRGVKLEADPTVQYAMGYQLGTDDWWNLNLTQADYSNVDSPYNTYLYPGLPPGPIANPGLDSILAVIYPAQSDFLFFRAACDGTGRHRFAITFEEHLSNACP